MKLLTNPKHLISTLALAGLLFAGPLRADVTVYIVAPGDTLWRIAHEQLKSDYSWQQLKEFNEIADHAELEVGQAIRLPQDWMKAFEPMDESLKPPANLPAAAAVPAGQKAAAQPSAGGGKGAEAVEDVAVISSVTAVAATFGQVSLLIEGGAEKLKVDMVLAVGSRIKTGPRSSANIVLKDGSMLVLLADTEVVLNSPIELISGGLEYVASNHTEETLVSSKLATVAAKQASFRMNTDAEAKALQVAVEQGGITVTAGEQSRHITTGIAMQLEAGKPMPEPRQGLLRPDLANIAKTSVNGKIDLRWPEIKDAAGYRAQLVFARDTYLVLRDAEVSSPAVSWVNVSPGRYNVRLRSIDKNGLEGLNANLSFTVKGTLTPPSSNTPKDGITLPSNRPWIAWGRVAEAYSYDLQVAKDAEFSVDVQDLTHQMNNYYRYNEALPPGDYYWRVRSVSRKRDKSAFGETRMFTIKP